MGIFRPLMYKVIIDMVRYLSTIFVTVFSVTLVICSYFCTLDFFFSLLWVWAFYLLPFSLPPVPDSPRIHPWTHFSFSLSWLLSTLPGFQFFISTKISAIWMAHPCPLLPTIAINSICKVLYCLETAVPPVFHLSSVALQTLLLSLCSSLKLNLAMLEKAREFQ